MSQVRLTAGFVLATSLARTPGASADRVPLGNTVSTVTTIARRPIEALPGP